MTSTNAVETEREASIEGEREVDVEVVETEKSNVSFGVELEDYLSRLETEFSPLADEISADQLRKIDLDLRKIKNKEINSKNSQQASQTLLHVFKNMKAWQGEAQEYNSEQVFLESCNKLYPGRDASLTLIGSEIYAIDRDLRALTDPEISDEIKSLGDFEVMANEISKKANQDPIRVINDLEKINSILSLGMEKNLDQDLGNEEQLQLDLAVRIIYKLQMLIDKIKLTKTYREQSNNHQNSAAEGKTKDQEAERDWKISQADEVWNKYLKKALNDLTIEEYLNNEHRLSFDAMGLDAKQNEYISEMLPGIWEEYDNNGQKQKDKIDNFKLRIGEMLHKASEI